MKLTEEQKTELQQELNYAVKYKETYDELYDHIVSEIETYDEQPIYVTSIAKHIIDEDFGGYEVLKQTEKDRVRLMNIAMRKKHWQHMKTFFNFPMVTFTIAATLAAYFISTNAHTHKTLLLFISLSAFTPLVFVTYKKGIAWLKGWYFDDYQKPSLKTNYIFTAGLLANSLFNLMTFAGHRLETNIAATVVVFVMYMVYVLSFFKLYRDEFKMQLT